MGNSKLPEKEFRIMIVKMTKNLENKMEKVKESINKDLEEWKNKHTETNKTITEVKTTLEGINSRISEAEVWISELENKMVKITSEEQNEVKRMKRTEDSLRPLGQYETHQHSNYRGPRSRREKERIWENFWRYYSWKFQLFHGRRNNQSSPRSTKSPIEDKPKEKHNKAHANQTNKN